LQVLVERRAQIQSNLKHWNSSKSTTEEKRREVLDTLARSEIDLVVRCFLPISCEAKQIRTGRRKQKGMLAYASKRPGRLRSLSESEKPVPKL